MTRSGDRAAVPASWNRVRALALIAVVAGIALSGVTRPEPAREPLGHDGYTVLSGDFHVHGFPDGILPWDAVREAGRRRLDVIALTSHNSMRGWWLWTHRPWDDGASVMVLPGEELTSVAYHLALVGVTRTVPWRQPIPAAVAAAHAQGGVAILAHPSGDEFRRRLTQDGLRVIDGLEIAHPQKETSKDARADFVVIYERTLQVNASVAAIGSSDFHYFAPIGVCRTYLFVREQTPDGVLDAIRGGRTVACDGRGHATGPAALASVVADRCREDALAAPVGDTVMARLGTALAWAGLVALVVLGPSAERA